MSLILHLNKLVQIVFSDSCCTADYKLQTIVKLIRLILSLMAHERADKYDKLNYFNGLDIAVNKLLVFGSQYRF